MPFIKGRMCVAPSPTAMTDLKLLITTAIACIVCRHAAHSLDRITLQTWNIRVCENCNITKEWHDWTENFRERKVYCVVQIIPISESPRVHVLSKTSALSGLMRKMHRVLWRDFETCLWSSAKGKCWVRLNMPFRRKRIAFHQMTEFERGIIIGFCEKRFSYRVVARVQYNNRRLIRVLKQ